LYLNTISSVVYSGRLQKNYLTIKIKQKVPALISFGYTIPLRVSILTDHHQVGKTNIYEVTELQST
jgi:hypothetical protein